MVDLKSGKNLLDLATIGCIVDLRSGQNQLDLDTIGHVVDLRSAQTNSTWVRYVVWLISDRDKPTRLVYGRSCGWSQIGTNQLDLGTIGRVVDLRSGQKQLDLGTIGHVVNLRSGKKTTRPGYDRSCGWSQIRLGVNYFQM